MTMHDKIIFLDIDGVLNSDAFLRAANAHARKIGHLDPVTHIDASRVARLNDLLATSQAEVCLSTSWRVIFGLEKTVELLTKSGLRGTIIGQTPKLHGPRFSSPPPPRGNEIQAWLSENPTRSYVILDDDQEAGVGHAKRFVCVPNGLTKRHVSRATRILTKPALLRQ